MYGYSMPSLCFLCNKILIIRFSISYKECYFHIISVKNIQKLICIWSRTIIECQINNLITRINSIIRHRHIYLNRSFCSRFITWTVRHCVCYSISACILSINISRYTHLIRNIPITYINRRISRFFIFRSFLYIVNISTIKKYTWCCRIYHMYYSFCKCFITWRVLYWIYNRSITDYSCIYLYISLNLISYISIIVIISTKASIFIRFTSFDSNVTVTCKTDNWRLCIHNIYNHIFRNKFLLSWSDNLYLILSKLCNIYISFDFNICFVLLIK